MQDNGNVTVIGTERNYLHFWSTTGEVQGNDRAVDLVVTTETDGFTYEDRCFEVVKNIIKPPRIAIGPHIIDDIFTRKRKGLPRTDGIILESYRDSYWVLSGLLSFKMGRPEIDETLKKMRRFLDFNRSKSTFLQEQLREYIPENIYRPMLIYIPPEPQITAVFAGQYKDGVVYFGNKDRGFPKFQVAFLRVDNPVHT